MTASAVDIIRAVVQDQLRGFRTAELGVVTAVYARASASDPNNYECDVRLRNSGLDLTRVPVVTSRVGAAAIPNQNDLVLIQFLHGDAHAAVIAGRLYNDVDRSPEAKPHECVYVCPDPEEAGIRRLYVQFPKGHTLTLDDDQLVLAMGATTITIGHDGDVVVQSNGKLTLTAKGDASLETKGSLTLRAQGDVTVEGQSATVKGTAGATLDGGSAATVKGATIKIAGKTDFVPA
jgi:phage baseplate assembly protein gpV